MEDYLGLLVSISDGLSFPKKNLFLSVGGDAAGGDCRSYGTASMKYVFPLYLEET